MNTKIADVRKYQIEELPINPHGVFMVYAMSFEDRPGYYTNVPVSCLHHSPDGFSWGSAGSGPADLSLNIVEYVVMRLKENTQTRVPCYIGDCSGEAWTLHQNFKREFIQSVPEIGGVIPWDDLVLWVRTSLEPDFVMTKTPPDLRLTVGYPHNLFDTLVHIFGNMDKDLSKAAFLSLLEEEVLNSNPEYVFEAVELKVDASPANILINDSALTGQEETELSRSTKMCLQYLMQHPRLWMIMA